MVELAEKTITAPKRQQAEGRGQQHVVLGRGSPRRGLALAFFLAFGRRCGAGRARPRSTGAGRSRSQPRDDLAKALAALFEVLEGVEAGAGRREQDDLAGRARRRRRGAPRPRGRRSGAARSPRERRRERLGEAVGGGADQVDRRGSTRAPARAAARSPRPSRCRRGSRGRRPRRRARPTMAEATLVALESLTKRTPSISATCSRRCGTPAKLRSPSRTASRSIPIASAAAAAAIALATLCSPKQAELDRPPSSGSPS